MNIILKRLTVGYLPTNCYIVACKKTLEASIIDPGTGEGEEKKVIDMIERFKFRVRYIVNTHGHPDHTSGNRVLKEHTRADILIHRNDAPLLVNPLLGADGSPAFGKPNRCPVCGREEIIKLDVDREKARMISGCGTVIFEAEISLPAAKMVADRELVEFGQVKLEVLHTPGHSRGSISLYSVDERLVFTGDTLFAGSYGRTDLAGGSEEDMIRSLRKLGQLPAGTAVYPGHGPLTTIATEKEFNPYL